MKEAGRTEVEGFIHTGWYPTAARFSGDGRRIFVLSGKGLTSLANPRGPQPGAPATEGQFSGAMLTGALASASHALALAERRRRLGLPEPNLEAALHGRIRRLSRRLERRSRRHA